ncbi:hypothetical protein [Fictibacillus terranigra]
MLDEPQPIDLKAIINNMTNLRNLISHQDVTPNITQQQVDDYAVCLSRFSKALCEHLEGKLFCLNQQFEAQKEIFEAQREAASDDSSSAS